ncbi:MAG: EF-hand domain-containing protein [Solidesulfovibrio sp. DCME]|uniref:EF-hand domain-containing protein n=1 Tax=Solidesulfovibrio sp. DCME TaxID=3447380 RepID=UPI003D14A89F
MPKFWAFCLSLAMACLCLGCGGTATPARRAVETSYPSPDYPPQPGEPATGQTAAPAPPQGRPLYGPVGQAAAPAPSATTTPGQATPAMAAPVAPAMAAPAGSGLGLPPAGGPRPAGAPNMGRLFEAMDADHNGRVTLEEWRSFHEREFRRLDKNDDGVLTREEMTAPPPLAPGAPGARKAP